MNWQDVGIELPANARGNVKAKCPNCVHTHSRGKQTAKDLSVNVTEGVWNCHRCGWAGKLKTNEMKIEYSIPEPVELPLSEGALKWFKGRGIGENTLMRFAIASKIEFMPQAGKEMNCIVFPYLKNGKLVNNKYRDGAKNFKLEKGAELSIFNHDGIDGQKEIIITEGEIDALTAYECGIFNVCSVPNGAAKSSSAKLEYLDNCYNAFKEAENIIIATDGDEPGVMLRDELARRLGKHRCKYVEYPKGCKDLNEVLLSNGPEDVKKCIENAVFFPVDGILSYDDEVVPGVDDIRENGYPEGRTVGLKGFDYDRLSDEGLISFIPGQVTTITGVPGSGKSTFLDNIIVKISARQGDKIGICSFETQPASIHSINLQECFIGKKVSKLNKECMTTHEYNLSKSFVREHFYFFKMKDSNITIEGILERAKEVVMRYGITFLVIDPYNKIEHKVPNGMSKTDYVAMIFNSIKRFAEDYGVHVFFVAHPRKMNKDEEGEFEVPNLYSIADSAHFYNMTDNGISVHRYRKSGLVEVYVQKIRFSFLGKEGKVELLFDQHTKKRYCPVDGNFDIEAKYYLNRIEADQGEFDFSLADQPAQIPFGGTKNDDGIDDIPF